MPAHRKAVTAADMARILGLEAPEETPGPNENAVLRTVSEVTEPNEALVVLALSLGKLMDTQPSASTARQLRETVIALADLVPRSKNVVNDSDIADKLVEAIRAA